jgi:REP element-mobilizing transposase RayT
MRIVPCLAGVVYHVTNRAHDGVTLFETPAAYVAFVELIEDTRLLRPIRILAYCVMPNHWHLLLWPETDDAVQRFVGMLSMTMRSAFRRGGERWVRGPYIRVDIGRRRCSRISVSTAQPGTSNAIPFAPVS